MGSSCSVLCVENSIPEYSIEYMKSKFPIVNDDKTFGEYIRFAQENGHLRQIHKYLLDKGFIVNDTNCLSKKYKTELTTGTQPFNVFARYASYEMKNPVDQTIIQDYMKNWMVCHNKPENDMNWNDVNNKTVSMCGPDKHGPGHVFITTKDLHWMNFNIATIVLSKKVEFLKKLKEVAEEYVKQRKWTKAGFYFHCFPHNSVNSLHLHIVNEDEKYIGHMHSECGYKNLPLDVAIKVAESL